MEEKWPRQSISTKGGDGGKLSAGIQGKKSVSLWCGKNERERERERKNKIVKHSQPTSYQ